LDEVDIGGTGVSCRERGYDFIIQREHADQFHLPDDVNDDDDDDDDNDDLLFFINMTFAAL